MLKRCLDSLNHDEMIAAFCELIVVDNGSTDLTSEVLDSYRKKCDFPLIIINEQKVGLSHARNAGVLRAQGNLLIFTDDDCYLTPNYLQTAARIFNKNEFSYCGGNVLLYDQSDSDYGCSIQQELEIILPHSVILPGKIQGANMVFCRKVFNKIGLFDTALGAGTPFRCEDIDICARASLAGFVGARVPELSVYHHHGRKKGDAENQWIRDNDYARGAYYAKLILAGHWIYLKWWIKLTLLKKNLGRFVREILGFVHYFFARMANLIKSQTE